jgi:hypothetical protein
MPPSMIIFVFMITKWVVPVLCLLRYAVERRSSPLGFLNLPDPAPDADRECRGERPACGISSGEYYASVVQKGVSI